MKILLGIIMVVVLALTAAFTVEPAFAAYNEQASMEKSCHDSEKTLSDKCCDKGICKCVGGLCHNIYNLLGDSYYLSSSLLAKDPVILAEGSDKSVISSLLKRPPRA